MKSPHISRRTVLRGAGASLIALPLLEEMRRSEAAQSDESGIPVRAFNVFFGLGIPAALQTEGFDGVLEPLRPLREKLLIMRNINQVRCDQAGINAHFDGASGAFTATPPDGEARAGGASIDQLIRRTYHPRGLPAAIVPTLIGGTFFRRSRVSRYVHSYNRDGTVAATIQERPRDLFDRVFGSLGDSEDDRSQRLRHSVLDAVVDQYQFYTGSNSPLGSNSRRRISDHLERIREYELRAFEMNETDPNAPQRPVDSQLAHGGQADPGGEGIDMKLDDLVREWRLMADLFALAIELDRARFGSLTFLAAGERLRVTGDYDFNNRRIFTFDDSAQLGRSGAAGCSHEWWHRYDPQQKNEQLRAHAHMKLREIAYFLARLDRIVEPNGKSILENSCITISTESGDGRHSDPKRELSGVFHAISGAGGRFKTGQMIDVDHEAIDVYNTMLAGMGTNEKLGPETREGVQVDRILA